MTISYYLLQFSTHYATLYTWNKSRRENRYASGRRDLLDNETSSKTLQCIGRNYQAVCQDTTTESRQIWRSYSYPRRCNTGVYRKEAKQKIASIEAQNVESSLSLWSGQLFSTTSRVTEQLFSSCKYLFVSLYNKQRQKTTVAYKLFCCTKRKGGKCVVV
jgi:hypothetical protein